MIEKVLVSFVGYLDLLKDAANSKEFMRKVVTIDNLTKIEEGKTHTVSFSFPDLKVPYESFFGEVAQVRYYLQAQLIRKKPKHECIKDLYIIKNGTKPPKEETKDGLKKPKKEGPIGEEVSSQDKSLHINIRVSSNYVHLNPELPEDFIQKPSKVSAENEKEERKKESKEDVRDEGTHEPGKDNEGEKEKITNEKKEEKKKTKVQQKSDLLKGSVTFFVVRNRLKNMVVSLIREEDCICLSGDKFPRVVFASEIMEGTPRTELATAACSANSLLTPKNISIPFFINTAPLELTPSFRIENLLTVRYILAIDIYYSDKNTNRWSFPITIVRD